METDACTHEQMELRRWVHSNGSQHIKMQCLKCGAGVGNAVPKDKAPSDLAVADVTLRARYEAERTAAFESERRARREAWQSDYAAYLTSPEWKGKRDKVLKRANYVCEGCGEAKATVVHHLTYDRKGNELLFDLVAVCQSCHDRCHPDKASVQQEAPGAFDLDDEREAPCYACRFLSTKTGVDIWCAKFAQDAVFALSEKGPCGPNASQRELLR